MMSHKQLPQVGYDHFGAGDRWDMEMDRRAVDVDEALREREAKEGRTLNFSERRDYHRGWRLGAITYLTQEVTWWLKHAKADELEAFADDLRALAQKHGIIS